MSLGLTVLGCDGSYAGPGGTCSGYLVQEGGTSVWLDAGPGTLANLQRHIDLDALDAVVLTHAHPDHWVDVLTYHNALRYLRPRTGVAVYSPAEVRKLAVEVNGPLAPAFQWNDVHAGSQVTVGGLSLSFSRTDHGPETLAVRVDDATGRSLGYSADTGAGWSLSELGPRLDLALCEASLAPENEGEVQHLTAAQAGTSARAAGARHLVITHLQPGVDHDRSRRDASEAFGLPVDVAAVGARYEVSG